MCIGGDGGGYCLPNLLNVRMCAEMLYGLDSKPAYFLPRFPQIPKQHAIVGSLAVDRSESTRKLWMLWDIFSLGHVEIYTCS